MIFPVQTDAFNHITLINEIASTFNHTYRVINEIKSIQNATVPLSVPQLLAVQLACSGIG